MRTAIALVPLKLLFKCIPEGTHVDTPSGTQAIESLRAGDLVIGFRGDPVKVMQIHSYVEDSEAKEFLTVGFEDGSEVDLCTLHRIHGTRAGKLNIGDELRSGHVVKSIVAYAGVERSYDLLTEDKGYRINGVPVNSMINEMYESGLSGGKLKN